MLSTQYNLVQVFTLRNLHSLSYLYEIKSVKILIYLYYFYTNYLYDALNASTMMV